MTDWDEVEELAFRILEMRERGPAGVEDAAALMDEHPHLAQAVRQVLDEITFSGVPETGERPVGVPERLGPYVLGERLGQGGMGAVYAAYDQNLGRLAAVKIVRPELLGFGQSIERFQRETAIVARLSHPGIVPVYAVGDEGGVPWFAMELVRGPSLSEVLRRMRETPDLPLTGAGLGRVLDSTGTDVPAGFLHAGRTWEATCLDIAVQVAQALAHAHAQGVLHRDVKPSNIALDATGRARLLDFGLARDESQTELTATGMPLGSLAYMAPEQVRGRHKEVGATADVYALGVTLYEMLTLKAPFLGGDEDEVRRRILSGDWEPVRRVRSGVAWETATVCAVAMDPDPSRRYPDMEALARDLAAALHGGAIAARPPGLWRRARREVARRPGRSALLAIAVAALVGGPTAYSLGLARQRDAALSAQGTAEAARAAAEQAQLAERRARLEVEELRGVDRRRSYIAHLGAAQLARRLGQGAAMRDHLRRCPEELRGWEWHHLQRAADQSIQVLCREGGFVRRLALAGEHLWAAFADGTVRQWRSPVDGLTPTAVMAAGHVLRAEADAAALTVAVSADGRHLLTGHVDHRARLWDGATGTLRATFDMDDLYDGELPPPHARRVFAVATDPAGVDGWIGSAGGVVARLDLEAASIAGQFRVPLERGGPFAIALAPDGSALALSVDQEVRLVDRQGALLATFAGHRGLIWGVGFSPDGNRLLTTSQDHTARIWNVATGATEVILVGHDGEVQDGVFNGDGTEIWTGSSDGTLRRWDAASGAILDMRIGHDGAAYGLAFAPEAQVLVSGGLDGTVRFWGHAGGADRQVWGDRIGSQPKLFVEAGGRVTALTTQGETRSWMVATGEPTEVPVAGPINVLALGGPAGALAWARDAEVGPRDDPAVERCIAAWDPLRAATDDPLPTIEALTWVGTGLAAATESGRLWFADGADAAIAHPGHGVGVTCVAGLRTQHPDGPLWVSAGADNRVCLWRGAEPQPLWEATLGVRGFATIAASPDDEDLFFVGGWDRVIALEVTAAGSVRERFRIDGLGGAVRGIAFMPGRVLFAGSDRLLHVADITDGTELVALASDQPLDDLVTWGDTAVTGSVYARIEAWRSQ